MNHNDLGHSINEITVIFLDKNWCFNHNKKCNNNQKKMRNAKKYIEHQTTISSQRNK